MGDKIGKSDFTSLLQIYGGLNVLLLHTGLALLEAGRSRKKNVSSALTRQLACLLLSITAFWICGYAFAFGKGNSFIGSDTFYILFDTEKERLSHFFLHALIASLPSSILGGAVAERAHFTGHLLLSVVTSGLIYPVAVHWVLSNEGWLNVRETVDVGGVLPTHVLSGSISLIACLVVGRRIEKFGSTTSTLQGHSLPLAFIGGLLIILGLIGKSIGITASNPALDIGQVVVNCLLSAAGAGTIAVILYKISISKDSGYKLKDMSQNNFIKVTNRRWSFFCCLNGCVAGLVAVQGGVGTFPHWGAWVVGLVAGCLSFILSQALAVARLDDCTETVSVHLGAGIWGAIAAPLMANKDYLLASGGVLGLDRGLLVGWGLAGVAATVGWSIAISALIMLVLLVIGKLRVDSKVESMGADVFKMEEQAYPSIKTEADVTVDGTFYHFKSPGLSPILHKKNPKRPIGMVPAGNASLTAVVTPCYNGGNYLSSTQKLEMRELSCSIPKIIVEEADKMVKPRITVAPPPPAYVSHRTDSQRSLPSISVSDDSGIKAPPSSPNNTESSSVLTGLPVHINTDQLRLTLKNQKQRLKATTNLMKRPSVSLMNRNDQSATSSISSTCSIDTREAKQVEISAKIVEISDQPESFNYLDKGKSLKKKGEPGLEISDDVFVEETSKVSGTESGFCGSSSQLNHQGLSVEPARMKRLTEKELEESAIVLQEQLQQEVEEHNESNVI